MRLIRIVAVALLALSPAIVQAESMRSAPASNAQSGMGAYVGAGVGVPSVAYGSSSLAFKLFGGYKVHEFDIGKAGTLALAAQGEYINFGDSSLGNAKWKQSGLAAAAVGSWVIPRKWAPWADEKVAVVAKAGLGRVTYSSNSGLSYTSTGLTHGVGADYYFTSNFVARAMIEYFPGSYNVYGISGMYKF